MFDKADEISKRNIERAICTIEKRLQTISDTTIDKQWFETDEALALFALLTQKIAFEPDSRKLETLASVAAVSGTYQFSKDDKKLSVFEFLSRLSYVQMKLLLIISQVTPTEKEVDGETITQTITGVWRSDIRESLLKTSEDKFWEGTLELDLELEILCSLNTLYRPPLYGNISDVAYRLTVLGHKACEYFGQSMGLIALP